MDECPNPRPYQALAFPGKPPTGALVVNESQVQVQIVELFNKQHEWETADKGITYDYNDCTADPIVSALVRVCKWCNEARKIELPT